MQNLCASTFEQLGFEVKFHDFSQGVNVLGVQAGQGQSGEYVLISAHYDTTPGCNGDDDNASGVAGDYLGRKW